jgi:hypothetical protein
VSRLRSSEVALVVAQARSLMLAEFGGKGARQENRFGGITNLNFIRLQGLTPSTFRFH